MGHHRRVARVTWRTLFATLADAQRYLQRIRDPEVRAAKAAEIEVSAQSEPQLPARNTKDRAALTAAEKLHKVPLANPTIHLTLPYPPSVNAVWRAVVVRCTPKSKAGLPYRAKVLLSSRGRQYRKQVLEHMNQQGRPCIPGVPRLAVTFDVHPPDRRRRDVSNIPKAVEDALTQAGLWTDDSQIDELHIYRRSVQRGGLIHLTVTSLATPESPHA